MRFPSFLLSAFLLFTCSLSAQEWVEKMQEPTANYYEIKDAFEQYWQTHDKTEKGKGYKVFKRWEHFVAPRVYPSGDISQLSLTQKNFEAWTKAMNNSPGKPLGSSNLVASATWTAIGPMGPMSGQAGNQFLKSGRLNFVTVDPSNTNNLWAGAPAGGLWKSTNGGSTWTTNTDNLTVVGCSDLAIDPTNTSVMYLATGDGDAGDTRSIGVLKSTNGGTTWNVTGLTNPVTTNFLIRRLIINPANTQILLAATNTGIYRTTNGGATWSQVATGNTYDLEFKPGDPNTVYAGGNTFRRSTNGGASFVTITSGIPSSGFNRLAIAVTPADANYVYVLASASSSSGFAGMYRSVNGGTGFTLMTSTPNLLGWNSSGSDNGGQGWYDLCVAASPNNKDEVVVGGVNVWRSVNGGTSWSIFGHWTGNTAPFTHADQHDLEYDGTGTLYVVNDGTIYRRTATNWQEISGTMNISQIYKIGMSSLTANKWITGHQDNGTSVWNGTTYQAELGGDGMDCFIDRTNDQNLFGSYQNGDLMKSANGGLNWASCTNGITGNGPWVTAWKQDPQVAQTLYCGYQEMFKSTNMGNNWLQIGTLGGSGSVVEFAIAPSNNQVIYVIKGSGVYKTTNGGSTWSNVTNNISTSSAAPQYISIDPTNANKAWVVLSGYSNGNKVWATTNGGSSWTNISGNLPNLPANCILYQPGSNDRIYVGMDVGIYHRDASSANWAIYNTGLPNVPISELEISPASPTLLHASTYGRGVWVASVFSSAAAPISNYSVNASVLCSGTALTFIDQSVNLPTTWGWTVTPATGVTINSVTAQNPVMTFAAAGTYTVRLRADNANGQGTVVDKVLVVAGSPAITLSASQGTACSGKPVTLFAGGATSYTWSHSGGTASSATFIPVIATVYTVTGSSLGCKSTATLSMPVNQSPNLNVTGGSGICNGQSATLLASGAANYQWSTGASGAFLTVSPAITTNYTVTGVNTNGCSNTFVQTITVFNLPVVNVLSSDSVVCPESAVTLTASGASTYQWLPDNVNGSTHSTAPISSITFTVIGTDANNCSDETTILVRVMDCTALNEVTASNNLFALFPNPVKGILTIEKRGGSASAYRLTVFDAAGKLCLSKNVTFETATAEINLSELAAGNYLIQLGSNNGEAAVFRIVKE